MDVKRRKGEFVNSFAVFGYMRSPDDKHQLIVDEEAAAIVRNIFNWKQEGWNALQIANHLNKLHFPSPMEYKKKCGQNYRTSFKTKTKAEWSAVAVLRILKNPVYTGVLEQGKTTTPNYKVKTRMDITFRNLVYDYYSKDLSSKVKTAMRSKQEKGEFITCFPYGYKPSPENKHKMVIDEPAAEIVREIFDAVIDGKTTSEIAANLNARGIPTPQEYKGVCRKEKTEPQWTHPRIAYMIRNIKYTGVMTNHTRESRFIRDKNQRRVPMSEWIIHPDAHEAIIPREKWEQANEMLRSPKKVSKAVLDQPDRVYYCAHCGRKLRKTYGSDQYYSCASAKYQHDSECSGIRLKRSEMEEILIETLRAQINLVKQSGQAVKKEKVSPSVECYRAITQVDKELVQLRNRKLERYEAYRSGEISREDFIKVKDQITMQTDELTAKKEQLEKDYQALLHAKEHEAETKSEVSQAEKVLADFDAGLREHLYEAIEQVIVTSNEQIEIKWVFADVFNQKEEIC